MTLQEAKDQVARKHLFKNWENFSISMGCAININQKMLNEVADLYARSKWEEACEQYSIRMKNRGEELSAYAFALACDLTQETKPNFKP